MMEVQEKEHLQTHLLDTLETDNKQLQPYISNMQSKMLHFGSYTINIKTNIVNLEQIFASRTADIEALVALIDAHTNDVEELKSKVTDIEAYLMDKINTMGKYTLYMYVTIYHKNLLSQFFGYFISDIVLATNKSLGTKIFQVFLLQYNE